MELLGFLTDASPWWWVALAALLGIVEVLTFTFFLIWPAAAALAVALLSALFPGLSGAMQILIFALIAGGLTFAGRRWLDRSAGEVPETRLNSRAAALVGRTATVIDGFQTPGDGVVEVRGVRWTARLKDKTPLPVQGDVLRIAAAEGMVLVLEPPG